MLIWSRKTAVENLLLNTIQGETIPSEDLCQYLYLNNGKNKQGQLISLEGQNQEKKSRDLSLCVFIDQPRIRRSVILSLCIRMFVGSHMVPKPAPPFRLYYTDTSILNSNLSSQHMNHHCNDKGETRGNLFTTKHSSYQTHFVFHMRNQNY